MVGAWLVLVETRWNKAMAPRANWKGHLKVSLASYAVALYPATTMTGRIRFTAINKTTGNRLGNQLVDSEMRAERTG